MVRCQNIYPIFQKLFQVIKRKNQKISKPVYDYLVGKKGIATDKWSSTEWSRNITLPPQYGIVSTNSSEASNSMYEDARHLP
jgi:hypothetical protein